MEEFSPSSTDPQRVVVVVVAARNSFLLHLRFPCAIEYPADVDIDASQPWQMMATKDNGAVEQKIGPMVASVAAGAPAVATQHVAVVHIEAIERGCSYSSY